VHDWRTRPEKLNGKLNGKHKMTDTAASQALKDPTRLQRWFLLLLALLITVGFYQVVEPFIISVLMAAIFAGMARPFYLWLVATTKGKERASAVLTVLALLMLIIVPAILFVGMLASQALNVSESVGPWLQAQADTPGSVDLSLGERLRDLPLIGDFIPERDVVLGKLGEAAGRIGRFLVGGLAAATRGTVNFFFQLCIMLYANFFFLRAGPEMLSKIMYLVPLQSDQEERLVSRFVSVTRATLKGTVVIGIIQGGLAGLAFAVVGIEGAIFWGTIMAVLSIIPAVGAALVWGPAVIYLVATSQVVAGLGLLVWCGLVVGSSDNILRPILVGKDTKMPDLLVLLSTLGGLSVYGALGVIIGPIIAALFLTVWELYGETFREILPEVKGVLAQEGKG
jgi:predicted PurR-regulated permease PerM